jgi:MarR family 2-MHQ and catechol resistance regulon transcriptional repressor
MTYVLDKLEKRGWISRTRDQHDKRTYYVDLTKEGRAFIEDILPKHIHLMHQILSVLTLDEQKTVNELLKKLGYHAKSLEG